MGVMTKVAKTFVQSDRRINDSDIDLVTKALQAALQRELEKSEVKTEESFCPSCLELLYNPVTLHCGHTSCKSCILRRLQCKICREDLNVMTPLSVNVALSTVIQKLHPTKFVARGLTLNGERRLAEKIADDAILLHSQALHFDPFSHVASNNRAQAQMCCGNFTSALEDATQATNLAWRWSKGYLTKGEIFLRLNDEASALVNFLISLALDESQSDAKLKAKQIVSKLMLAEYQKQFEREVVDCGPGSHHSLARFCHATSVSHRPSSCHHHHHLRHHNPVLHSPSSHATPFHHTPHFSSLQCKPFQNRERGKTGEGVGKDLIDSSQSLLEQASIDPDCELMSGYNNICRIMGELPEPFIKPKESDNSRDLLHISDFDCTLCLRPLFQPSCTPCGHTFCRECLERSLDYSEQCPLCKTSIREYIRNRNRPTVDQTTQAMMAKYFPAEYEEKLKMFNCRTELLRQSLPIFVCTIAFPSVPCPLYVYEPRYKLMIRRVVDFHDNHFGVCATSSTKPFHNTGTLVTLKNVFFYPDGRSIVECTGTKRFSVRHFSQSDGYNTAEIKYIQDEEVSDPQKLEKLNQLLLLVYEKARAWYKDLDQFLVTTINKQIGEFPELSNRMGENGPDWVWWVLAVLPVEDKIKLQVLGSSRLKERLTIIFKVLMCIQKRKKSGR